MKKNKLYLVLVLFILSASPAFSESKEKSAKSILDKMSDKYQKLSGFSAFFTQKIINKQENIEDQFSGNILVKQNKFKLNVAGQVIYNNGKFVWTYIPDDEEVTLTTVNEDEESSATFSNPTKFYTIYKKGYSFSIINTVEIRGHEVVSIKLTPTEKSNTLRSVVLTIDTKSNELLDWKIEENTGNEFVFSLSNFEVKDNLADSSFIFDQKANPDVEVIDLR